MSPKIEYIRIDADILLNPFISLRAKVLLSLVKSFSDRGLMLSNQELAKILCCSEDRITKLLVEIKAYIQIVNPGSRYRKIFYSVENSGVETELLRRKQRSKNDSTPSFKPATPSFKPATPSFKPATPSKTTDITKETEETELIKTDFSFSSEGPQTPAPSQDEEPLTKEQLDQNCLKMLGFDRLQSEGIVYDC